MFSISGLFRSHAKAKDKSEKRKKMEEKLQSGGSGKVYRKTKAMLEWEALAKEREEAFSTGRSACARGEDINSQSESEDSGNQSDGSLTSGMSGTSGSTTASASNTGRGKKANAGKNKIKFASDCEVREFKPGSRLKTLKDKQDAKDRENKNNADDSKSSNSKGKCADVGPTPGVSLEEMMENNDSSLYEAQHAWSFDVPRHNINYRDNNSTTSRGSLPDWTILDGPKETDVTSELRRACAVIASGSHISKSKRRVLT